MVIEKLLAGELPELAKLRRQLEHLKVKSRETSKAGFFTEFEGEVPPELLVGNRSFKIGDVTALLDGMNTEVGFLLFIEDGKLNMLEAYTFFEDWPQDAKLLLIGYDGITGERNLQALSEALQVLGKME